MLKEPRTARFPLFGRPARRFEVAKEPSELFTALYIVVLHLDCR